MTKMKKMIWDGVEYNVAVCPFCGKSDIELTSQKAYEELFAIYKGATISLSCANCSLDMYEHTINTFNYHAKLAVLVNKWNERRGSE